MPGTLYVVSTPIGNLGDLTPRAAAAFEQVDFIAAEDTRVTLKLLNHLGLKKPLLSYHEHSAPGRSEEILRRIEAGESCALCSDAGTPAISDPGETLVAAALARGLSVVPLPGASALVVALSAAGQSTGRFVFEGFLPQNRRQRALRLAELENETRTMVLYEAPHKLAATLKDLAAALGESRSLTLCRELTKRHEEILPTTLAEALALCAQRAPRGEYVLVVAGRPAPAVPEPSLSLDEAARLALRLAAQEQLSASAAARRAAAESGQAKSSIYRHMQALEAGATEADAGEKEGEAP